MSLLLTTTTTTAATTTTTTTTTNVMTYAETSRMIVLAHSVIENSEIVATHTTWSFQKELQWRVKLSDAFKYVVPWQ
jgi:hypothetical protein